MTSVVSRVVGLAACCLIALSFLYTPNSPPLTSGYLEFLAAAGWGGVAIWGSLLARGHGVPGMSRQGAGAFWLVAMIVTPAVFLAVDSALRPYEYPMLTLAALLCVGAAAVAAYTGHLIGSLHVDPARQEAHRALRWILMAIFIAALVNALVGIAQYLQLPLAPWIGSQLTIMGRSYGNLRQPNQYVLVLAWGFLVLLAWLQFRNQRGAVSKLGWLGAGIVAAIFAMGIAVSGSRAGGIFLWVIGLSAVLAPRLHRGVRLLMLVAPLFHVAAWWSLVALDLADVLPFYSTLRTYGSGGDFNRGDVSNSRFAIWRDTWLLIEQRPWTGYGFYRLNKELVTTDLVQSNLLTLVNAHNIVLQWAFEFGIPAVLAWLLVVSIWLKQVWRVVLGPPGLWLALAIALPAGHSMLEHPWWFLQLLLPSAFAAGLCTAAGHRESVPASAVRDPGSGAPRALTVAGAAMVLGSVFVWSDHERVQPIYLKMPSPSLAERLESAYATVWFRHFVDQAVLGTLRGEKKHCDLGHRAVNFYLGQWAALNVALSCARTGDMAFARKLVAAVERGEPQMVEPFSASLGDAERAVFEQLRSRRQ